MDERDQPQIQVSYIRDQANDQRYRPRFQLLIPSSGGLNLVKPAMPVDVSFQTQREAEDYSWELAKAWRDRERPGVRIYDPKHKRSC